jgi:Initiator Replication protein
LRFSFKGNFHKKGKMEKAKKNQSEVIREIQNNPDYIILNNPLAAPKFVRQIGRNKEERPTTDIYTQKIFFEIVSKLTPAHLENTDEKYIQLDFNVSEFLDTLGIEKKENYYKNILNSLYDMQNLTVKYETDEKIGSYSVIPDIEYKKNKGDLTLDLNRKLVEKILDIRNNENFSFLKRHLYLLQNGHAIKIFPYLVSWKNRGMVELSIEHFKKIFGYDTEGYSLFNKLKIRVIEPAIKEITEKTTLDVTYKLIGSNLDGQRPRIKAIRFLISEKKQKLLKDTKVDSETNNVYQDVAIEEVTANEKEAIYLRYESVVISEFGVNGFQFSKLLDVHTEVEVLQAIEITTTERDKGKLQNVAGFFIEALKNKYQKSETVAKQKSTEKKTKLEADTQKEQAQKGRVEDVKRKESERKTGIIKQLIADDASIIHQAITDIQNSMFSTSYKTEKTVLENLENPMFVGGLMNALVKLDATIFDV